MSTCSPNSTALPPHNSSATTAACGPSGNSPFTIHSSIVRSYPALSQLLRQFQRPDELHGIEAGSLCPFDVCQSIVHEKNLLGRDAGPLGGEAIDFFGGLHRLGVIAQDELLEGAGNQAVAAVGNVVPVAFAGVR